MVVVAAPVCIAAAVKSGAILCGALSLSVSLSLSHTDSVTCLIPCLVFHEPALFCVSPDSFWVFVQEPFAALPQRSGNVDEFLLVPHCTKQNALQLFAGYFVVCVSALPSFVFAI